MTNYKEMGFKIINRQDPNKNKITLSEIGKQLLNLLMEFRMHGLLLC